MLQLFVRERDKKNDTGYYLRIEVAHIFCKQDLEQIVCSQNNKAAEK